MEKDITAVFVCNDLMAYGFYHAAKKLGKKIPHDISIIGFDDLLFSSMLDVPLTSVKQNIPAISSNISMLLDKLLAGDLEINNIVLPTIITERNRVKEIV